MIKGFDGNDSIMVMFPMHQDRLCNRHSRLPQVAVTCKIESLCLYSSFGLVDSLVLLNRHLRQAANRQTVKKTFLSATRIADKVFRSI